MSQPLQYAHHEQRQPFNLPSHSSQAPRISQSPPSFNMDRMSAPVKMGSQIYESYASISPSAHETYSAFQTPQGDFPIRQIMVQDPNQHHQPENPIARFISEESSWDPLGGLGGRQHGSLSIGHIPDYSVYRNTAAPSEADTIGPITLLSDSGYGSMPRQSVGIPSVYGDIDNSADTQSLIQGVSDFQFHPGLSPESVPSREGEAERKTWKHHGATNSDSNDLFCQVCKTPLKTRSELKKHEQRHSKPHRCDMEKCPRNGDGFSTLNDLARHKQTVHKVGGTKYRCNLGQCASKKKDWPRADNFKQHLARVHGSTPESLESFIYRPQDAARPPSGELSEAALLPPPMEAHSSSISQPDWCETDTIQPSMNMAEEPGTDQLDNTIHLSGRSSSMDSSALGELDHSQYRGQIPFDGMGLDERVEQVIPQFGSDKHHLQGDRTTSEQMLDSTQPCINPDILNHIRTSFPGEQFGTRQIRSQTLELEPDVYVMYSQEERGAETGSAGHIFSTSSGQVAENPNRDTVVVEDDSHGDDTDDSGASDDVEQFPSPRAASEDVEAPKVDNGSFKSESTTAASTPESMNLDVTDASALVQGLMKKQMLDEILQQLGYRMIKESDMKSQNTDNPTGDSQAGVNGAKHLCDHCSKSFSRPCELRKHRKRHDKPYACTYAACDKRFGSKNDWKRHENSQHFQLECWKCNEKAKDSLNELCGKVCHRRETFTNHLEKDHNLDHTAIEGKWSACRVGRNCETRFWCGFCKVVVELEGRGGLAWTERFNHIDEHFNGRNGKPKVDISEWKSVESEPLESLDFLQTVKPQASRNNRGRVALPDRHSESRKRYRSRSRSVDPMSAARRKRLRLDGDEVFWSCCSCNNVWNPVTTGNTCMNCSHTHCGCCTFEAHDITENVSTVS